MNSHHNMRISYNFKAGLTPLGKNMLILYSAIYITELIMEHWIRIPVVFFLQLWPINQTPFQFWQVLTSPFIHNPQAPVGFLLNCLVLYFFSGSVERALGTRRFCILFYASALGAALCGILFSMISGFDTPFMGMMPSLLALVVVFGLLIPEAMILFMFIIPIKAKYLSYGTVLILCLTFLAKANAHGAYHLGGIFFGYLCFKGPKYVLSPSMLYLRYSQWQFERKKRERFRVIEGYKGREKPGNDDKPTYH